MTINLIFILPSVFISRIVASRRITSAYHQRGEYISRGMLYLMKGIFHFNMDFLTSSNLNRVLLHYLQHCCHFLWIFTQNNNYLTMKSQILIKQIVVIHTVAIGKQLCRTLTVARAIVSITTQPLRQVLKLSLVIIVVILISFQLLMKDN